MSKDAEELLLNLSSIVLNFSLFFYKPLVIMIVWNWFIPEIFSLSTISYALAFGLMIFISVLRFKSRSISESAMEKEIEKNEKTAIQIKNSLTVLLGLSLSLFIAFIVQAFIG